MRIRLWGKRKKEKENKGTPKRKERTEKKCKKDKAKQKNSPREKDYSLFWMSKQNPFTLLDDSAEEQKKNHKSQ
ncbi:MAG: hypothetical protein GF308_00645 [Candidatus Heimdallarchaeota archaeon]|nr:hypothetical protein [Candidatus Heimdallarchaeota archaeon]